MVIYLQNLQLVLKPPPRNNVSRCNMLPTPGKCTAEIIILMYYLNIVLTYTAQLEYNWHGDTQ